MRSLFLLPDPKRVHLIQSQVKKIMHLMEKAEIVPEAGNDARKAMDVLKRKSLERSCC